MCNNNCWNIDYTPSYANNNIDFNQIYRRQQDPYLPSSIPKKLREHHLDLGYDPCKNAYIKRYEWICTVVKCQNPCTPCCKKNYRNHHNHR